ncbi:MAG TPA: C2 family cysteine protease [Gemmatales bacterium]|nr:C2 family cysteine protease [Gemmatales bacterium]
MSTTLRNTRKLIIEALEDRTVPTTATFSNGILSVVGTNNAETIRVTQDASRINVEGVGYVAASSVRGIVVDAKGGNDYIDIRSVKVGATVYGGDGNDMIVGTLAADSLFGGYGNDRIWGMDGNDYLYGEAGNDILFAGNGNDAMFGGDGNDFMDDGNRSAQEYADGGNGMDWNADVVAVNGTRMEDVHQLGAPTCGFLSSLQGLARTGTDFTQWIRYAGNTSDGTPQYSVAMWNGSSWSWITVNFTGDLTSYDPQAMAEGESWTILMQRAWIQFHGNNGQTWPHDAIKALSGRQVSYQYSVGDADYNRITTALSQNKLVEAATVANPTTGLLVGGHAYTVVQTWFGGGNNFWVQVRNPWGVDGGSQTDGGNDGLVWVPWNQFKASMNYLAIA